MVEWSNGRMVIYAFSFFNLSLRFALSGQACIQTFKHIIMSRKKEIRQRQVKGKKLVCPVCGHDHFWTRRTLMNTPGLTFFGLDWANRTSENYVCDSCGHVLWFLPKS